MNLPGPYMTWLLSMLGAEVVKLENPLGGDYSRVLGGDASSPFFGAVNRNKKSIALNLKHPEGKRIFLDLIERFDVLVEGFRPGTMGRFGLGYEDVGSRNPRIIYVSISGYGQDGPYKLRAGHDINYTALAGILGMTGTRNGTLAIPGVQIADIAGGSLLAMAGLLAAVIQRQSTGRGQHVDTSMFHGALSLATMVFASVDAGYEKPEPCGMMLNGRFPCYGLYKTKDERYMSLGAIEFKFWKNFCEAVDRPDLVSGQFGGPGVIEEVNKIFSQRTLDEWVEKMKNADACCEPVLTLEETLELSVVAAANMVDKTSEGARRLGFPMRLSDSRPADELPPPGLGRHTGEILAEIGVTHQELKKLQEQGVV